MENENELPQVEQEIAVEEEQQEPEQTVPREESVTLSKAELNRLTRKAIAYDTIKKTPPINKQENRVDSIDQIKLGKKLHDYSDDELDFVTKYAGSKNPEEVLKVLNDPFVVAGIQARRELVEKEKLVLKPSGTQPDFEENLSLDDRLERATSFDDKQTILQDVGLYQEARRRTDGPQIRVGQNY